MTHYRNNYSKATDMNNIITNHKMCKYLVQRDQEKYAKWGVSKKYVVEQKESKKDATKIHYTSDIYNVTKTIKKIQKKGKNELENPKGDYMNSIFEHDLSFFDEENDCDFVYNGPK